MTVSERRKGLRGQQEVQRLFQSLGIDLDKLAAQGDRVWYVRDGEAIRLEVKRQERARLLAPLLVHMRCESRRRRRGGRYIG